MDSQIVEEIVENSSVNKQGSNDKNNQDIEKKSKRQYDIIVFGASGFTGQFVVKEMHHFSQVYNLTWAIAGRNTNKLQNVLDNMCQAQGKFYFYGHLSSKLIIGTSHLLSTYKGFHFLRNVKNHCVYCLSSFLLKQQWSFSFL